MCTLTYFPKKEGGFIVTSNRDESPLRPASIPKELVIGNRKILMPVDQKAGGSWLGISSDGNIACLLNGAFRRHRHMPPYSKSRGIVLLDSLQTDSQKKFISEYDFKGIEPFTLVHIGQLPEACIHVLRWDGVSIHLSEEDAGQAHIWSSTKMYPKPVIAESKKRFLQLGYFRKNLSREYLLQFHHEEVYYKKMERLNMPAKDFLATLSIISIDAFPNFFDYLYFDLLNGARYQHKINIGALSSE